MQYNLDMIRSDAMQLLYLLVRRHTFSCHLSLINKMIIIIIKVYEFKIKQYIFEKTYITAISSLYALHK